MKAVCLQVITDLFFINGVYCTAQKHAALSSSPVFSYEFAFDGTANVFKTLAGGANLPGQFLLKHIVITKFSIYYCKSFTNMMDALCLGIFDETTVRGLAVINMAEYFYFNVNGDDPMRFIKVSIAYL